MDEARLILSYLNIKSPILELANLHLLGRIL